MKLNDRSGARAALIFSMLIFGTIGVIRRYIPLPSGMLAFLRGAIGAAFLMVYAHFKGGAMDRQAIRGNIVKLCVSGAFIGFNWILLFEAYNYTTVATATLCYYMAPTIVILASPIVLGERLTLRRMVCVVIALAGVTLVSGILSTGFSFAELRGALMALGAAVLYADVIIMNKRTSGVQATERTTIQLAAAAVVVLPYSLIAENVDASMITPLGVVLTLVAGVLHTGFAYAMYFGSLTRLSANTAALFSYIDPIFAVILSALLLKESMDWTGWVGAALVLGAAVMNELSPSSRE